MSITVILLLITALAAGFAGGVLYARSRSATVLRCNAEEISALRARAESDKRHFDETITRERDVLRKEIQSLTAEIARRQSDELLRMNDRKIGELLSPLNREIRDFRDAFVRNNASTDERIAQMLEKTLELGTQTEQLRRALTAETKTQGNWGEGVLKLLLESSGLQEGTGFELQYSEKDDAGRNIFPDAVVHLPGNRNVVIDSKVSLTAFYAYANAESKDERTRCLKEHISSVKRHIDELSAKDYARHTPGAIGFVFMFLPTEAGYVAAVGNDLQLTLYAYRKKIILLNPTTLLSVLRLADNLWNSENQSRSVGEIIDAATKLYDKFAVFANNYARLGDAIRKLQQSYDESEAQLTRGRGNIMCRLENLKAMGVKPTKDVPRRLEEAADYEDSANIDQSEP